MDKDILRMFEIKKQLVEEYFSELKKDPEFQKQLESLR